VVPERLRGIPGRLFKNKAFTRFAKKADIVDAVLCRAVRDAERGLIAADLGGGVTKQRIARPGQGKSGGFRVLIVLRAGVRAIFVHGFSKSDKEIFARTSWVALRKLAVELLAYDDEAMARVVASGTLVEVRCNE
jgi:hypothetical protein